MFNQIENVCRFVGKLIWLIDRADLHFAIEESKSHIEPLMERVPKGSTERGRGMRVKKDKVEANVSNWVFNNFTQYSKWSDKWRSKPTEVRLIEDEVKTKGLYERNWMRWLSLRVKESMRNQGRLDATATGLTFSMDVDEVK